MKACIKKACIKNICSAMFTEKFLCTSSAQKMQIPFFFTTKDRGGDPYSEGVSNGYQIASLERILLVIGERDQIASDSQIANLA
jgi:hypothetical protein